MINPFVLLPLYSYPMGTNWDSVYAAIEAHPSVPFQVIVNPSSGPASSTPDAAFAAGVSKLNAYNNTQTIGYIHILDATRSKEEVLGEVDMYAAWGSISGADAHLDGIFFDESPNDATADTLSYVADIAAHARSALATNSVTPKIVLNPGTPVDDAFYKSADVIVAIEVPYSEYSDAAVAKVQSTQRTKSAVILNSFTADASAQGTVIDQLVNGDIPGVYITDGPQYNEVSSLFGDMVSSLGGVAPIAGGSSPSVSIPTSPSTTPYTSPSSYVSTPTTLITSLQSSATQTANGSTTTTSSATPSAETTESSTVSATQTKTRTRKHRRPSSTSSLAAEPTEIVDEDDEECDSH